MPCQAAESYVKKRRGDRSKNYLKKSLATVFLFGILAGRLKPKPPFKMNKLNKMLSVQANKDLALRDGMTAELTINAGEVVASRVPQSVLTLANDGRLGVRVVDNGRVALRPVQIISDDQNGAVVTGLAASEMVIVRGGEYTRDGREVEFEMEQTANAALPSREAQ